MTETEIMRAILVAVSALPGGLFWRQNVGVFRAMTHHETIRCGVPGMADIGGMYQGKAIQIEVKTSNGRLSVEQKRWKNAVERAGGVFVLARNPAEALSTLAALLDAQSVELPTHPNQQPVGEKPAGKGEAMP